MSTKKIEEALNLLHDLIMDNHHPGVLEAALSPARAELAALRKAAKDVRSGREVFTRQELQTSVESNAVLDAIAEEAP